MEVAGYHGSVAPGVWSFQLAARARGLGSAWTTFHLAHERAYTFKLETPVEFVNFQVTAIVTQPPPDLSRYAPEPGATLSPKQRRRVAFDDGWYDTQVFARDALPAEEAVIGPAIIEEPSATTVVHPGQSAHLDRLGNLILELEV